MDEAEQICFTRSNLLPRRIFFKLNMDRKLVGILKKA